MSALFRKLIFATLFVVSSVHADMTTTSPGGATFTTAITADNAFHVAITPPPTDTETTQQVYLALAAFGRILFIGPDGSFTEWAPGASAPAMFTHAQSQCRSGNTFGFTQSLSVKLAQLPQMMPGAVYYAGYGADLNDLLVNQKFAPVYVVPAK